MPHAALEITASGAPPNVVTSAPPINALRVHATGSSSGFLTQGQTSAWANISKPITISGGNRINRQPVASARIAVPTRNTRKNGSHE
ncbi:hypothetical protein G6F24_018312 [Rhizopus arrhizus]|nr:hypothetical protein G6F24_018312 [Rhizopus arrhizus]